MNICNFHPKLAFFIIKIHPTLSCLYFYPFFICEVIIDTSSGYLQGFKFGILYFNILN